MGLETRRRPLEESRHGYEGISNGGEIYGSNKGKSTESIAEFLDNFEREEKDFLRNDLKKLMNNCLNLCKQNLELVYTCFENNLMDQENTSKYMNAYNFSKNKIESQLEYIQKVENRLLLRGFLKEDTKGIDDIDYDQMQDLYSSIETNLTKQNKSLLRKLEKNNLIQNSTNKTI